MFRWKTYIFRWWNVLIYIFFRCNNYILCGDGYCDFNENCHSCPQDCGECNSYSCNINNGGCDKNAYCIQLTNDIHQCKCKDGYTGNGKSCIKVVAPKIDCTNVTFGIHSYPYDCCSSYYNCYGQDYASIQLAPPNTVIENGIIYPIELSHCQKNKKCDLNPICGNGECELGENCELCPNDCGLCQNCGDGICSSDEDRHICPKDCSKRMLDDDNDENDDENDDIESTTVSNTRETGGDFIDTVENSEKLWLILIPTFTGIAIIIIIVALIISIKRVEKKYTVVRQMKSIEMQPIKKEVLPETKSSESLNRIEPAYDDNKSILDEKNNAPHNENVQIAVRDLCSQNANSENPLDRHKRSSSSVVILDETIPAVLVDVQIDSCMERSTHSSRKIYVKSKETTPKSLENNISNTLV